MESDRYGYHHHGFRNPVGRFRILVMGLAHSQIKGDIRTMTKTIRIKDERFLEWIQKQRKWPETSVEETLKTLTGYVRK